MAHRHNPTEYAQRNTAATGARAAITRLNQIEGNVVGATLAQTQAAARDMAAFLKHLIRYTVNGQ